MSDDVAAEWVALDELTPWAGNPRRNDIAAAKVAVSIKRFGFGSPILARRNGEIIAGHTRLKAAEMLGLKRVPVRYLDISEKEARLLALADNKLGEVAAWNAPMLAEILSDYGLEDAEFAGWDSMDLGKLADEVIDFGPLESTEVEEDEVPEPPADPVTKLGDVWTLGDHTLVCGDSTDPAVLALLVGETRSGLMVTDPPWGVSVVGGTRDARRRCYQRGHKRKRIANDDLTGSQLADFLGEAYSVAAETLRPGASWYVWYAGTETVAHVTAAQKLGGFRHVLVWVKPSFVFGRADYHYRHEPCLYGWTPGAAHVWLGDRKQSSVFEVGRDDDMARLTHPTAKPVALFAVPVANHLKPGEAILDIFAGSGPAFSAAEQSGRRCFGVELDPAYCDVIVERWQNLTGGKATRA